MDKITLGGTLEQPGIPDEKEMPAVTPKPKRVREPAPNPEKPKKQPEPNPKEKPDPIKVPERVR